MLAVIAGLVAWGATWGAMYPILHYVLPYLGVNCWLVGYTWLQHTDVDVPHFDSNEYTWAKGAFHTIDRPYGPVLDFLHHGIGSTHVTHHVNSAIPHYNAWKVTEHLKSTFPDIYLYDPTPGITKSFAFRKHASMPMQYTGTRAFSWQVSCELDPN